MIAIGFKHFDTKTEVTIVGKGDRAHVDAVVAKAPSGMVRGLIDYLKPFVEGGRPSEPGNYMNRFLAWWKPVEILP